MQFKHPEILYALFGLIIPIIVHLFNLQRFVKIPFSNVAFLKNIQKQTRKSSQLKKWLVLLSRLAIFTCIIIAFAQPFTANFSKQPETTTAIYLDNSYSMQAKAENGKLLPSNTQKVIEHFLSKKEADFSLFTNNKMFTNFPFESLKNELINIDYSSENIDINSLVLKINNNIKTNKNTQKNIILISDFQKNNFKKNISKLTNSNTHFYWVQTLPKSNTNYFIDSVYVQTKSVNELEITAIIKSNELSEIKLPVSLVSGTQLMGKTTANFKKSDKEKVKFTLPKTSNFKGFIAIENDDITFDNTFYFTINTPKKIKVLNIGKKAPYLSKIYTESEFEYTDVPLQNLQYSLLQKQQLIILNELTNIPKELSNYLQEFVKKEGSLVIIPAENSRIESYNFLLQKLSLGKIDKKEEKEHLITHISYQHPIFKNVFERNVTNFEYPKSKVVFRENFRKNASIMKFANQQPFISSYQKIYWISSPLSKNICNFQQSPLIVPVFYNFAMSSYHLPLPYYTIGKKATISLNASLSKNEIATISNEKIKFIPLQKSQQNNLLITLNNNDLKSGLYHIKKGDMLLQTIALNYNRFESITQYKNIKNILTSFNSKNHTFSDSITSVFEQIDEKYKINRLFKWFLALSVLFLLIEMLILKFFKT